MKNVFSVIRDLKPVTLACFHSCVGRIRYLGVLLYDADRIEEIAKSSDENLIEAHRSLILIQTIRK